MQQLELLKPRSMLPTNMIYEKRCLSARNQLKPMCNKSPVAVSRNLKHSSSLIKCFEDKPKKKVNSKQFKQTDLELELESFALFLDDDEIKQRREKEISLSPKMKSKDQSKTISPSFKGGTGKNVFRSTCDREDIIPISEDTLGPGSVC